MISTNHHQQHSARKSTGVWWSILLVLSLDLVDATLYKELIYDSDIMEHFGSNGCIEGTLAMAPTVPVILQSPNLQDNQISSSEHEMAKVLKEDSHTVLDSGTKEKTPMCLVNELARYHKIEHQYRLTNEEGPPHKKKFTVTLKLGNEEYTSEGPSIKKAQHSAAAKALQETNYKHPPPKTPHGGKNRQGKGNITPTVELNALAMKRGEPTEYTVIELPPMSHYYYNYHHKGMYTQRYQSGGNGGGGGVNLNKGYKVSVTVGDRKFIGEGATTQAARHDAASKALQVLRELPLDTTSSQHHIQCDGGGLASSIEVDSSFDLKSPISLVHEIALKRNMSVNFEVVHEKGPPHMRTFITKCRVGDQFETKGEGNGKKVSKKRAAEKMLEQLRTLPPMTTISSNCNNQGRVKRKTSHNKRKPRNLIKETNVVHNPQEQQKYEAESIEDVNPISRLIQIQQAKREKEPVYTLKEEKGTSRRREFLIEVTVGDNSFIGVGPNKKLAKRNAAEGVLQLMGYSSPVLNNQGSTVINSKLGGGVGGGGAANGGGGTSGGVSGRQLVPGLLLMNNNNNHDKTQSANSNSPHSGGLSKSGGGSVKGVTTGSAAKEYLNSHLNSQQSGVNSNQQSDHPDQVKDRTLRPTEELHYLSQVFNFKVQYSDFPKGNHNEFLSLVTLSTDPPQVCHGAGPNTELSKDQAALNALKSLAEMGLDSISPKKSDQSVVAATSAAAVASPPPIGNNVTLNSNSSASGQEIYMGIGNSISKDDGYVNGK